MNGICLFSGYAGISIALRKYFRPILYCEIEKYSQGTLLSRMDDESIPFAPIWNDVTTLDGGKFRGLVDAIWGGFPCQDISVAGNGEGLKGERSKLFFEIIRLASDIRPKFIFLENVPAIVPRGLERVLLELTSLGYDNRWTIISAEAIGANHQRERWFCVSRLVADSYRMRKQSEQDSRRISLDRIGNSGEDCTEKIPNTHRTKLRKQSGRCIRKDGKEKIITGCDGKEESLADSQCFGQPRQGESFKQLCPEKISNWETSGTKYDGFPREWTTEPDVGRVANGVAFRSHRIKALGNGVVPAQAEKAFEYLMGLHENK